MDIAKLSAVGLARAIREKKVKTPEVLEAVFERIDRLDAKYRCYITTDKEGAMKKALRLQEKIDAGEETVGALCGVPLAVKDNLCTKGLRTSCASRMLSDFVPSYSAEAVERLERAGAIVVGKTNMDEFAMGSTTETSFFEPVKNPMAKDRSPGGSSGGSAAAVALGECFAALGSDTGGSVRLPAGHCGVVGMKPTYGTVSRYGLIAYASSMDQIGPITQNVEDCAAILEAMAGYDPKDSTSVRRKDTDFTAALTPDVRDLKIGIPRAYFADGMDREVKEAVLGAARQMEKLGAFVEETDLKYTDYAIPAYYTIACAEASSNLERYDGVKYGYRAQGGGSLHEMYRKTRSEGFGREVKRRLMLGTFVLSEGYYEEYYLQALKVRGLIKKELDEKLDSAKGGFDLLLAPVAPSVAPKLGEAPSDPLEMYLGDIYTVPANLAGLPAISLPCGRDSHGLMIGFQLIGGCFEEKKLLRAACAYECAQGSGTERGSYEGV